MKNCNILGFIAGAHSCGACYIKNGEIIAVIEEERLTRVKPYIDFDIILRDTLLNPLIH